MMINCLIVDDEPVARKIVKGYCSHLPFLHVIGECGNAFEAKEILDAGKTDLLFLDINMPVLNGVGLLNTLVNPPQVIFTTAYQEYAVNAFDLSACDYLLKPFSLERFMMAVDKAKEKIHQKPDNQQQVVPDFFFIKAGGRVHKLHYGDILFAEAKGNYTKIVLSDKILLPNMSFSELEALLPVHLFARVHRSFVINLSGLQHLEGNTVHAGGHAIPIGSSYRAAFFARLGLSGT
jgi:DNA-binding LytR/AlgR family response regulator